MKHVNEETSYISEFKIELYCFNTSILLLRNGSDFWRKEERKEER